MKISACLMNDSFCCSWISVVRGHISVQGTPSKYTPFGYTPYGYTPSEYTPFEYTPFEYLPPSTPPLNTPRLGTSPVGTPPPSTPPFQYTFEYTPSEYTPYDLHIIILIASLITSQKSPQNRLQFIANEIKYKIMK